MKKKRIEHEHITTVFDPIDENGNKINTNTGHLLECSICKVVLPNNNHIFDRNNPIKIDEYNNSATNYHYIVCSCGFKEKERHFFSERYLKLNADPNEQASYHTKACKCGFEMQEEHWFKSGRTVCMYCGYGA